PDSDYDVRFVYVRPLDHYLRLGKTRDVIEWQLDDTLDINGWDLQKALRLLHSSNPTIFEWWLSPIVYRTSADWESVAEIIGKYYEKRPSLHHYLCMAKRNYREFLTGEQVKLKKYFYVLRPILACRWILSEGTPPPMLFDDLAARCLSPEIAPFVGDLLAKKRETPEIGLGPRVDALNDYLLAEIERTESTIATLPLDHTADWETLDRIFTNIVK
ncbi:MAG: nucleotidyltransferase domain-containing protein, partial [Clostridia bacterium]|nr:nucleotidyltransferase domain-containing protein [Clostridia bacterium]